MPETIDNSVLVGLKEIIGDDVNDIIQTYLDQLPEYVASIKSAYKKQDAHELAEAAHTFKGSSSNLGIIHLTALCLELERMGKSGSVYDAEPLVQSIDEEIPKVVAALKSI